MLKVILLIAFALAIILFAAYIIKAWKANKDKKHYADEPDTRDESWGNKYKRSYK